MSQNHNNGKASNKTTQNQSESQSDPVAAIQNQADLVIDALRQAGLANAAGAIQRHAKALEINTQELTQTLETLMDPDLPLALAELRAARNINARLGKRRELSAGGFQKIQIEVPEIPAFNRFYSQEAAPATHQLEEATATA